MVIGIGNEHRGDDAAGLLVARRLRERGITGVQVREFAGDAAALIDAWEDAPRVILIDAVCSGAMPGTLHRIDAGDKSLVGQGLRLSSHGGGVGEAVELARALHRLPRRLVIYGIEGKSFGVGQPVSDEAARAIDAASAAILWDLVGDTPEEKLCTNGL